MENNRLTIEELVAEATKKFGEGILIKGSEVKITTPRLTTGLLAFDLALGGGWAANQWNEIVGNESSGKTALAYRTIATNQALDPAFTVLWVAAEEYVPSYAASLGVDLERLWVVETNEMESALGLVLQAIENRLVDMVVIDSLPALVAEREAEKSMDEASIAPGALILGKFFRKSAKAQRRSLVTEERNCTLIAINQWREKIGVMFGDPRTTPGGNAKNYFYFTRVEVRRDEWLSESTKIEDRVGQTIKMRVMKNKTYRPQQVALADFYFANTAGFKMGEFDTVKDIVNVCLSLGMFEGRYKWKGERLASKKEDLYARVREDLGLQRELRAAALDMTLGHPVSFHDDDELEAAPNE